MFFCNQVKARKKLRVQNEMYVETCSTTDIFNSTLQYMKLFLVILLVLMTIYDMKCSSKILIQS